jgi:hypothetical protein
MDGSDFDLARTERDAELVAKLRHVAAQIDSVPEEVLAAARAAITTRNLDGELAALLGDSAGDDDAESDPTSVPLAFEPVRSETAADQGSRMLAFASRGVQLDLEVRSHGDHRDLIGQLTGASADGCVLELATGEEYPVGVDGLGRFLVEGVRRGPVRVRCRSIAGGYVITAWVTI